jgi:hypothetical protein
VYPWLSPLQFGGFLLFPPKPRFFEFTQNRKGNIWIWEKPLFELVPYVEVTLVSKFHPIWCFIAQESKLKKSFGVDRTYPAILPDISSKTGHIRSNAGHVCWTVFSPMFIHCFGHILLTECPFDPILLPLAS